MSVWQYLLSRWSFHWVIRLRSVTISLCLRPSSLCCLHAVIQNLRPVSLLLLTIWYQMFSFSSASQQCSHQKKYVDALLPSAGSDYEGMHYGGRSVTPGMRLDQWVQLFTQGWNVSTACWNSCLLMGIRDIIRVARLWLCCFFFVVFFNSNSGTITVFAMKSTLDAQCSQSVTNRQNPWDKGAKPSSQTLD